MSPLPSSDPPLVASLMPITHRCHPTEARKLSRQEQLPSLFVRANVLYLLHCPSVQTLGREKVELLGLCSQIQ